MNDLAKLRVAIALTTTAIVLMVGTLAAVVVFSVQTIQGDRASNMLVIALSLYAIAMVLGRLSKWIARSVKEDA